MNKAYNRINWENYPSDRTPLNEQNLNRIDGATDELDNRVITLDTTKATKAEVAPLIKEIEFNESNGIFTITRKNGSKFTIDTKLEKIAINFGYDTVTQKISLTLIDGTIQYIDLSALITQYEFMDTDTVSFFIDESGKVSAIVKDGSIQEKHLQPNYLAEIKVEAAKAESAATAADASKTAAAGSAATAATKAGEAAASATNAANSATAAETSKTAAAASAATATNKANEAAASATNAANSKTAAATSATNAANSASAATTKANAAAGSATAAATSATSADTYAKQAQSYAVGTGGVRPNEATDNAKYYYEQSRDISQGLAGALMPMGTVTFANLPALADAESGWMYNISNQFTTTGDFKEGAGNVIPAGSNVYKTADGKWDVLAGTPVTGVKGNTESSYRKGNVNLTPENIGAVAKTGDKMTGRLEIKTPSASPTAAKLVTGDEGNQRIFYGSDSIESVTPGNAIGILKLNPEGNGNNGRVVTGSPLHVAGGLSVDNALGNVFANMRDFRFLPVFNGYTGDAGTGGIFGYLERKACGLAPFWHWATTNNYEAYYYKITVGAEDTDAEIVNWMISFELTVYQSYRYCKFAISGYVHYLHNTENNSYDLIWYEPRAEMIAGGREFNNLYVYFGKDTDGHLYVAINALSYTGLVIDTVNVAFQDIVVDYSNLFSLELVPTLDNTTKYANILTSRPFYLNEANELKNSVSNGKAMVASAITIKGVYTAADADFLTMANNIGNIYRGKKMIGSVVSSVRITSTQNTCTVSFSVGDKDLSTANCVSVYIVATSLYVTNATMSLSGDLAVGDSEWGKQTQTFAEIRKASHMLTKKNNYSITLSVGGVMQNNYASALLICYYGTSF